MNPVILTADDPEPPVGSVMLGEGGAWQRASDGWYATGLIDSQEWYELFEYEPTLTLVYSVAQPPPDHPSTWTYGDPEPPAGTILAANRQPPVTAIGGHMYATDRGYCREDELNRTAGHCQVLRWGWNK